MEPFASLRDPCRSAYDPLPLRLPAPVGPGYSKPLKDLQFRFCPAPAACRSVPSRHRGRQRRTTEDPRTQETNMYAVMVTGGKQYRVMEGETLRVELLPAEVGNEVTFGDV